MELFIQWIQKIILFSLFASIIQLLIPNSALSNYVKMAIGFIFILLFIEPIIFFTQTNLKQQVLQAETAMQEEVLSTSPLEEGTNFQKEEIVKEVHAYKLKQASETLQEIVADPLRDEYQLEINQIHFYEGQSSEKYGEGIDSLELIVEIKETPTQKGDVHAVESVKVMEENDAQLMENNIDEVKIKMMLSKFWEIESQRIQLKWVGATK